MSLPDVRLVGDVGVLCRSLVVVGDLRAYRAGQQVRSRGNPGIGVSTGNWVRDQGTGEWPGMDGLPAIPPVWSSREVRSSSVAQVRYGRQLPLSGSGSWAPGGCGR